jgi:hypothetical protein
VASGPVDLQLQLALYRGDIDDMILWFPDFRFVWSPRNFHVAREGLDLTSSAELALFGHTHSLSAHASWSRVRYRGGVLEGQVAYRPEFSAGARARIHLGFGEATAGLSHVGRRRAVAGSDLNALASYDLFDVGLALPFRAGGWQARIEGTLSNLLDQRAALLVDYPLPGRGWALQARLSPTHRP